MEGSKANTGKNAERKSTEEAQQESTVQVGDRTQRALVTADDIDKIAIYITGALAGCAYLARQLGYHGLSEFFGILAAQGLVVSAVAYLNERHWLPYGIAKYPWRFCVGILLLLVTIWGFLQLHLSRANLLLPGNGETPPVAFGRSFDLNSIPPALRLTEDDAWPIPKDAFKLFFGDSIVAWANSFPVTVFAQDGEDIIVLDREDNSIFVTASFFTSDGKIVCKVSRNKIVLSENNLDVERESSNKLAVTSDEDRLFEIEYINRQSIRLTGDFYMRDGVHIVMKEHSLDFHGMIFGPGSAGVVRLKHGRAFYSVDRDEETGELDKTIYGLNMRVGMGPPN